MLSMVCWNVFGCVGNDVNFSIMWLYDIVVLIVFVIMKNSMFGLIGWIVLVLIVFVSSGNIVL